MTFRDRLIADMRDNPEDFRQRIEAERALLRFAESCAWDRSQVLNFCCDGTAGMCGLFAWADYARSYDRGLMRAFAEAYDAAGKHYGI